MEDGLIVKYPVYVRGTPYKVVMYDSYRYFYVYFEHYDEVMYWVRIDALGYSDDFVRIIKEARSKYEAYLGRMSDEDDRPININNYDNLTQWNGRY